MTLKNAEVLENLRTQLKEVTVQLNKLTETRIKLMGAVEVLEQIEDSNAASTDAEPETDTDTDEDGE
jgi:hypothetical protein